MMKRIELFVPDRCTDVEVTLYDANNDESFMHSHIVIECDDSSHDLT